MSTITQDQTSQIQEQINTIQSEIQKAMKNGDYFETPGFLLLFEALVELEDMLKKDHRPLGSLGNEIGAKEVSPSSSGSSNSTQSMDDLRYVDLKDKKNKLKLLLEEIGSGEAGSLPSSILLKDLFNLFGLSETSKSLFNELSSTKDSLLEEL
ncbi:MAG: hypothetical protein H7A41_03810 [Chlamydiales bacterium]|nr:hypothetical protein [Chlamydiales bacterium]